MPVRTEQEQYNALVRRLAKRRRQLGLSQVELDERVGFGRGHISKYECGDRRPSGFNLANWVAALGGTLTVTFPRRTDDHSADLAGGL